MPSLVSPWQKPIISQAFSIHLFFFLSFFLINSSIISSSGYGTYKHHCNSIVSESKAIRHRYSNSNYLQFHDGYYIGGDKLINPNPESSPNFPKSISFHASHPQITYTKDVFKLDGTLSFRSPNQYRTWHSNVSLGVLPRNHKFQTAQQQSLGQDGLNFNLYGFWSQATGQLCMVGSGTGYLSEGKLVNFYVVFKLNYPQNSSIATSFVSGTLESVNKIHSLNYFEPISLLAFAQLNYNYTLISNKSQSPFSNVGDRKKGLPLTSQLPRGLDVGMCLALRAAKMAFDLEYESGCNEAKTCSPIVGGNGFLPSSFSFSGVHCSEEKKMRMLIGFYNSSFIVYDQPLVPERMLVGEGFWDEENNQLQLVVCRILNVSHSLLDFSVGDCSIRLTLWFPAVLSLRTRSTAVGEIWSNKSIGDSGYFDRIMFRSSGIGRSNIVGLKYEYTETDRVRKSCVEKKADRDKRKTYTSANSYNLRFGMRVGNDKQAWGYGTPLTVGDEFYDKQARKWDSAINVSRNPSIFLNTSYWISFGIPNGSKLADQLSYPDTQFRQTLIDIAAEGIYNTRTGSLCMIGCRFIGSNYRKSIRNYSPDCEIVINIQFPETDEKRNNFVKGSIKSTRGLSHPLYFDQLDFASLSLSRKVAVESVSRMDLEITMALIANTLICIFVVSQLFYVKKHPDVLPSISFVTLVILTLGNMIPLVLNFESMFLTNRNQQSFKFGSGGWLEVNEVLVRIITMIAFVLQFYLLQLTWSSRLGDGNQKAVWLAEKDALYVFLPSCVFSGFIAWLSNPYKTLGLPQGFIGLDKYRAHSIWGYLRPYAGLLLDWFLLPQILLNAFLNSKDKALSPAFYFGTTIVRLLPHAYDLYRARRFAPSAYDQHSIYANPHGGVFSTAWDIIIPCGGLLFSMVIYFQQRFGGYCILPLRFRSAAEYEKVPVTSATTTGE